MRTRLTPFLYLILLPLFAGQAPSHAGDIECYAVTKNKAFLVRDDGTEMKTMAINKGLNIKIISYDGTRKLARIHRFGDVRASSLTYFSGGCSLLGIN